MTIPLVDILYFLGTIALVAGMGIFIVRSMRSGENEQSDSTNGD